MNNELGFYRNYIESRKPEEPLPITTEGLLNSNQSKQAQEYREKFEENRKAGLLTLDWECSDARNWRLLFEESFYFHTIANGGDPRKLSRAANSEVTDSLVVIAHDPCGGRTAKTAQLTEGIHIPDNTKLGGFISCEVDHPSVIQAGVQARRLADLTDKSVTAMVRNHENGELRVLAEFNRKDNGMTSHLSGEVFEGPAPKSPLEDDNLLFLADNELSDKTWEYIVRYETKRLHLLSEKPNLPELLKIQNPRMIKLATDLRAAEVWIPEYAGPGNIFRLTTPRDRIQPANGEKTTYLSPMEVKLAWAQAEYVISHAVENRDIPNEPFRDTDTFFIATPNYGMSQGLALELAQQPFMHDWLKDKRNKIIVGQNNAGNLRRVAQMDFEIKNGQVVGFSEVDAVTT